MRMRLMGNRFAGGQVRPSNKLIYGTAVQERIKCSFGFSFTESPRCLLNSFTASLLDGTATILNSYVLTVLKANTPLLVYPPTQWKPRVLGHDVSSGGAGTNDGIAPPVARCSLTKKSTVDSAR